MASPPTLDLTHPYKVPAHIGAVKLVVMNGGDSVPLAVKAMMNASPTRLGLRIAGGCSNMELVDRRNMLTWFGANLKAFSGFVSSGGTREVTNGKLDPMVTEVPALLASSKVVTISTAPRTGGFELVDNSRLRIYAETKWGPSISNPNPGVHMLVFVQHALGEALDWDGDVETYVDLFTNYQRTAGWRFATIVWNGGGVTRTEVKMAARSGWPVILVEGSGRAADEYIAALQAGAPIDLTLQDERRPTPYDPKHHNLIVVSKDDPRSLHSALATLGFMP